MRTRSVPKVEEPIAKLEKSEVVKKLNPKLARKERIAFAKKIIEATRRREVIYHPANKSNRYVDQKEEAWRGIASELKVPVEKCKARWTSLRDRYRRISKEQEQSLKQGKRYNNCWRYYESLSFLSEKSLSNPVPDPVSSPAENQIQSHEIFTIVPYSAIDHLETRGRFSSPATKVERLEECESIDKFPTPTCRQESASNACADNGATSMFFMSLAKGIQSASLPPLTQMKLESEILNFTISQIEEVLKN